MVQRCQVHKRHNILGHLPETMHASVARTLRDAWDSESAELAERQLQRLARSLDRDHPGAAASVREGLEETLSVLRLGLTGALQKTLRTTNAIENLNSLVENYTRNVKRWRGGSMIQRWVSAALLEAENNSDGCVATVTCAISFVLWCSVPTPYRGTEDRVKSMITESATALKFNNG